MALQTPVADRVLLNRLKAGLSARLQDQAMIVTGDFDTVLSVLSGPCSAQQNTFEEKAWKVQEFLADGSPSQSERREPLYPTMKCSYCQKMKTLLATANK